MHMQRSLHTQQGQRKEVMGYLTRTPLPSLSLPAPSAPSSPLLNSGGEAGVPHLQPAIPAPQGPRPRLAPAAPFPRGKKPRGCCLSLAWGEAVLTTTASTQGSRWHFPRRPCPGAPPAISPGRQACLSPCPPFHPPYCPHHHLLPSFQPLPSPMCPQNGSRGCFSPLSPSDIQ